MSKRNNRNGKITQANPEPIKNPFSHLQDIDNKLRFLAEAIPAWANELAKADAVDFMNLKDNTAFTIDGLRVILTDLADELEQASEVAQDVAEETSDAD